MATLMLVDGHALAYRAYHAFPPLTTQDGELVNAVYGFSRILLTVIKDLKPEFVCVSFDLPKPTFRHTQYTGYKAQRKEMPTELQSQIDRIRNVVQVMNIPIYSVEGYEADDVIGTVSRRATQTDTNQVEKVLIVTGDRDAFQLVNDQVHVYMPPRSKEAFYTEFGYSEVEQKMGLRPDQIVDYKSLAGDASDNIPGVRGIGDKTAVKLLQLFGSSECLYELIKNSDKLNEDQRAILKPKLVEKLSQDYESMVMSRSLATIDTAVPMEFILADCAIKNYDKAKIVELFTQLGFKTLIPILPNDAFEAGVQEALF